MRHALLTATLLLLTWLAPLHQARAADQALYAAKAAGRNRIELAADL